MSALDSRDGEEHQLASCRMDDGDIVLFEANNEPAFIRASPESTIDLSAESMR